MKVAALVLMARLENRATATLPMMTAPTKTAAMMAPVIAPSSIGPVPLEPLLPKMARRHRRDNRFTVSGQGCLSSLGRRSAMTRPLAR